MRAAGARSLGALGLLSGAFGGAGVGDAPVEALAVDSRTVRPGTLFAAMPGTTLDGAAFIGDAVAAGAVAVLATPEGAARAGPQPVPVFTTETPRGALARLAAAFYGAQPDVMAAVTGTNGKTSTAHFLRAIWASGGLAAASLGTTGVAGRAPGGADFTEPLAHTTPEPITLHALLERLEAKGCSHAAMEASSHGLVQGRLDGVVLRAAALTHITRDHLDYHASHAEYVAAKLRLFRAVLPEGAVAVLNADDPVFAEAEAAAQARGQRVIATGRAARADLRIAAQALHAGGQRVRLAYGGAEAAVELALVGAYQAENVATAAGLALATGMGWEAVLAALPGLETVRGRMELAGRRANGAAVYVDYAHTPGAVASALASIRPHCAGRLVVVLGAGGDRDPGKRPMMGAAAAEHADLALITDDNPRSEVPAEIRRAVLAGCPGGVDAGERAAAIRAGVAALTGPGDLLLVAGKGHEQGQELGGRVLPFDDVSEARAAIAEADGTARMGGAA